ncbi:MAG: LexA family transcriptional regulator [Ruminococcus sp.]|nr:LexA family transcriptional regulator [Ruminococcus sp.]
MTFGNRLKQARENKGYNQKQFAERLGVTPTRLNYWEKDKREPDVAIIKQIAQLLDISSDWLIGNSVISSEVELTAIEKQHINKYRSLDLYGRKTVDSVLDIELERCSLVVGMPHMISLPMAELKASAGTGQWLGDDEYTERVNVVDTPEARKANVIIEVSGDSMEPLYHDGDTVLVKLQPSIEQGEIGIFIVDGCGYIKKLGYNELISVNENYDNIPLNEHNNVTCVGKAIGIAEIV